MKEHKRSRITEEEYDTYFMYKWGKRSLELFRGACQAWTLGGGGGE
jgi:hypothetical protein